MLAEVEERQQSAESEEAEAYEFLREKKDV
jgi:hypothetical protein